MGRMQWGALAGLVVLLTSAAAAQQVADTGFAPAVERPAYAADRGPKVAIDEAHLNFHTADGGYAPFAKLLRLDGYQVQANRDPFTAGSLGRADILVVANAMHKQSEADWAPLPTLSAFTAQEVAAAEAWVRAGGSLLLIADHMPLAGHAEALAAAFGVRFQNGFAQDSAGNGQLTFRRSDSSLPSTVVANGRDAGERVDAVTTFTGQAFRLDPQVKGQALLVLPAGSRLLLPEVAFQFSDRTPRIPAAHLLQGAIVYHGRGRVALLGEAAMLTAQLAGPDKRPMGMNAPEARENARFALNLLHWLSALLP
ncbi:MAG TPA: DUF4350 domain-containing protein [Vicinamibacterales bacterium]|nr:DUF4350 domain-containing protein [Vicinamibacterales bacterium]